LSVFERNVFLMTIFDSAPSASLRGSAQDDGGEWVLVMECDRKNRKLFWHVPLTSTMQKPYDLRVTPCK
jgi:hypothetical protein